MITELDQSYIRQTVDETVAGEIEGITVTDRIPIISPFSTGNPYITTLHSGWCLLGEITGLIIMSRYNVHLV